MSSSLSKEDIEDLLVYLGSDKLTRWKGSKIQACCPIHGESNPSFGVDADYCPEGEINRHDQVFHCFSCGESGTIPWLMHRALPSEFKNTKVAEKFLKDRYNVIYTYAYNSSDGSVTRYEDQYSEDKHSARFEVPRTKLAPFKSGKETYQYFFDRGFDKEDMRKFMIGRDLINETITIPVFWEDNVLAGIIGRYIDPSRPKNSRFKIYSFPKGSMIYPLNFLRTVNDTLIGVESQLDAMMLHKWGYPNTFATMGGGLSKEQADMIVNRCKKFIPLFDNDEGGQKAVEIAKHRLNGRVLVLQPSFYPNKGKDPSDWGELNTIKVLNSVRMLGGKPLPRL